MITARAIGWQKPVPVVAFFFFIELLIDFLTINGTLNVNLAFTWIFVYVPTS